jgi:luciferase family oxidoreductase group 1
MLGSSDYGARLAADFGLPYAFAYFFTDGQGVETALSLYRALYKPSARHPAPRATVCVWALAAETEAEARHHALSRDRWRLDRARGRFGALRPPDEIAAEGFTDAERPTLEAARARAFVGDAATVARQLRALAEALQLDELVVNTWTHDPTARRRSYALLGARVRAGLTRPVGLPQDAAPAAPGGAPAGPRGPPCRRLPR